MKTLMPNPEKNAFTYEMLGGGTITGSDPAELAVALRNSSYTPMDDLASFMADVAKRCAVYDHDAKVRTDTPDHFIEDLVACGFLIEPQDLPENVIPFPDDPEEGEQ